MNQEVEVGGLGGESNARPRQNLTLRLQRETELQRAQEQLHDAIAFACDNLGEREYEAFLCDAANAVGSLCEDKEAGR
jgi:hypothetical protein